MSKKEKDVELVPMPPTGWKVKHDGKEGSGPGPENYPKLKYDKDSGPHLMVFTLPKTPTNLTFNGNDPIAIKPGTTSPAAGSGIDPQFPDWAIFDGGKTLVVLNTNSGAPAQYAYTIKADNYVPPLDPIVDNGGGVGGVITPGDGGGFAPPGGGGGYDASWLIGAAIIGAVLAAAFARFVLRWRPQ